MAAHWSERWSKVFSASRPPLPALVRDTALVLADSLATPLLEGPRDALTGCSPGASATALAADYATVFAGISAKLAQHRYQVHLLVLAVAALADTHLLGRERHEQCHEAAGLLDALYRVRSELSRPVRRLLERVRDGVAVGSDPAAHVAHLRKLLATVERMRPGVLDVTRQRLELRLGGRRVEYVHDRDLGDGHHEPVRRVFSLRSVEGRLVLLLAAGRRVVSAPRAALSRARRAVEDATADGVRIVETNGWISLSTDLELTKFAEQCAARIESIDKASFKTVSKLGKDASVRR